MDGATSKIHIKDADSMSSKWQVCHVFMYSVTAALGLASNVVFYITLSQSRPWSGPNYYCYLYNAVLMRHNQSQHAYQLHFLKTDAWHQDSYCHDVFAYPLKLFVCATVWTALSLVFGHGGTTNPDLPNSKFFNSTVGQWRMVFWAVLFNIWCVYTSFVSAMWLTDGYRKFSDTVSLLPANEKFYRQFFDSTHSYYNASIILYCCQTVWCTLNFLVMFYRCAMGVDFEVEFGNDHVVTEAEPSKGQ